MDVPLFLSLHNLCATLKCTSPSAVNFRSAVINAGYRISGTHVNPLGLKSDAPMDVIWDIMRCWVGHSELKISLYTRLNDIMGLNNPLSGVNMLELISLCLECRVV